MSKNHLSSCGCAHDHSHAHDENIILFSTRLFLALIIVLADVFEFLPEDLEIPLFILAYLLAGYKVLWNATRNIIKGRFFDENFLMIVASAGAFALGDTEEAVSVMIFYGIGELLQSMAVQRSRKNIAALMDIRPDSAHLKTSEGLRTVHPSEVLLDDIIVVQPGEQIPLDGIVQKGNSHADTRAITGESTPLELQQGTEVMSGFINVDEVIEIRTTKPFHESTASKILELVENAQEKKAPSEQFITKFARYYTPFIVFTALAVATIPPAVGMGSFDVWIYRALTFLIVACPCALVISIPISFFGGIGAAARYGILVKGGNYLESLNKVSTIVFDKTGILTYGKYEVTQIVPIGNVTPAELIHYAAVAETHSTHHIARAIFLANGHKPAVNVNITESAHGIIAHTAKDKIAVGSAEFMQQFGISNLPSFNQTTVFVAVNDQYIGYILISDTIKSNAHRALEELKSMGMRCIVMLTDNKKETAQNFVTDLGLDSYRSGLLPQDKVAELEKLMQEDKNGGKVIFVGDGINDAPVISRADVGIAMGGIASDAAIAAANIVIMNDDISKISMALRIANKTRRIVMQNIVFALGVKVAVMILAFFGYTSMWFAIFADVGVALIAVLNALRAMKI